MSPRRKNGFEDEPDQLVFGMPPSTYALNSDIAVIAGELIAQYPEQLGHLTNFTLAYLRRSSSRVDNDFHVESASGSFIRSDRERAIFAGFDGGVWVQGKAWDNFAPPQRRAWVHSLLLRLGVAPKGGKLKMLRPDVVEWASIVRIYGPWSEQLTLFSKAHDDHEIAGSGAAADAAVVRRVSAVPPPPHPSTTHPH